MSHQNENILSRQKENVLRSVSAFGSCNEMATLIDSYVDGKLPHHVGVEVRGHLLVCAECYRKWKIRQELDDLLDRDGSVMAVQDKHDILPKNDAPSGEEDRDANTQAHGKPNKLSKLFAYLARRG